MKIIFWDYDGTIVDTETLYKKSIESFLKKYDLLIKNISDEYFFKNISGRHPEEFLLRLENDNYIKTNSNIDPLEIKKYYTNYFNELKKGDIKITKNIDLLIKKFSDFNDIIMCITSSSFRHDFILKNNNIDNSILDKYFNVDKNVYLCGNIDGCRFKPEPDVFMYAFGDIQKKYNLKLSFSDKLFVVEDSIAGCQAGKNFKNLLKDIVDINVIGYWGGNMVDNSENLSKNGADFIAKDTEELYKIINSSYKI